MSDIESVLIHVSKLHPQWCQLIKSVDTRVDESFPVLRSQIFADHRALLACLGWPPKLLTSKVENGILLDPPNPFVLMLTDKRKRYAESFLLLCSLQHLQARRKERQINLSGDKKVQSIRLWAIDELVSPIASRMEYHFSRWEDQPEFIFALVYKITYSFIQGVEDVLQPLIDRARLVSCSAKEAWISATVQMLSGFLVKKVFPVLAEKYKEKEMRSEVVTSWLHLVDLMVALDRRMQSLVDTVTCILSGGPEGPDVYPRGISVLTIFCERTEWLKMWAKMELKDAWKKLKAELEDESAWLVGSEHCAQNPIDGETNDYLLYSREDYKAPLIAESVLKIAWQLIERGKHLLCTKPRHQFIRSTSARFIWHFLNVLGFHYKKCELIASSTDDGSLDRLCILINTARYCESKLQDWSDDVNLLEMTVAENDFNIHKEDDANDGGCFFREEIQILVELEANMLIEVIAYVLRQFETLTSGYVQIKECFERGQEDFEKIGISQALDLAVSINLVPALEAIRNQLHVIMMSLNPKDFLDLWRGVAEGLDHYIFSCILMDGCRCSNKWTNQFSTDMKALFLVFQPFCSRPEAFFPLLRELRKLLEMDKEDVKQLSLVLSDDKSKTNCLRSYGISHISFDQAWVVLRNRKSMTGSH